MYKNDPRIISAKFPSVCHETGKKIALGESCLYYPSDKTVYCLDSKQAVEFREWKADIDMGHNY
jgi:hypothetical protein